MKITGSNVTIMVNDMDRSIHFYQSIGLSLSQRWDNHYAMLKAEGITIGLHPGDGKAGNSGTVSIGFMLDDLTECKRVLTQEKIVFKEEATGKSGIYLHFKDPDGTILYFVKPKW